LQNKSTILVVDDTETNVDLLLELLSDIYEVKVALDGVSAINIANEEKIDLILLDIMMPNMDGYDVCKILKNNQNTKDIPIIFITAKTDEDSIDKAYEAGGIDYVSKPFKPLELLARVKTNLKIKTLIEHLEFISSYDTLTDVYNRRKFFELAEYKFNHKSDNLYAVMIDIDKFKLINDTYGHPKGDEAIKSVANAISKLIAENSIFGRLGGEEFCIICTVEPLEDISKKVESIREAVENIKLFTDDYKKTIPITISAGYAKAKSDTKNLDALLKEADIALYDAKGAGRNRIIFRN
jgi:diguanylate cyclase (GGDEF)-like protein